MTPARADDLVAIVGIGGLGHLAVQYTRRMGFEVVAIGRGAHSRARALQLGAHHYVDGAAVDIGAALQALGGAALVVVTASGGQPASQALKGLEPRGRVIVLGASPEPVEASTSDLLFGGRSIEGALTGDPATGDATLRFSLLTGVEAIVETVPLERAPETYARMMAGQARFRIVLTMNGSNGSQRCLSDRNDLIIVAVHLIGFREGLYSIVMGFGAAHHSLFSLGV